MKKHIFSLSLIVTSIVSWLVVWDKLPVLLPTHWGMNGEVNHTSSVAGAFFLINGLLIGVYLLMIILPKIDPKKENYIHFKNTYYFLLNSIILLFFFISIGMIVNGLGFDFDMMTLITGFLSVFFIILGVLMQHFSQNYFVGIRTPWTLSNETVWDKTHKLGGFLYVFSGAVTIMSILISSKNTWMVMAVSILLSSLISAIYSYILFFKLKIKE